MQIRRTRWARPHSFSKAALIVSLLALAATHWHGVAAATASDPAADGPCGSERFERVALLTPASSGCALAECALHVLVTRPAADAARGGRQGCPAGPYPVVWLFSGFGARAGWYSYLARRLASHGYVVVQYNVNALILPDAKELRLLPPAREFLRDEEALAGVADWAAPQALVGHSRGGKLAALHLAREPAAFGTAVLIDPVDNTMFSPEGPLYPSAVKALKALRPAKRAAVVAAGVTSACNPADANYAGFYGVLAPGSWLATVPGATHDDFVAPLDSNAVPLPPVCGKGPESPEYVQSVAAAAATAWLQSVYRNESASAFEAFVAAQGSRVKLQVKP